MEIHLITFERHISIQSKTFAVILVIDRHVTLALIRRAKFELPTYEDL